MFLVQNPNKQLCALEVVSKKKLIKKLQSQEEVIEYLKNKMQMFENVYDPHKVKMYNLKEDRLNYNKWFQYQYLRVYCVRKKKCIKRIAAYDIVIFNFILIIIVNFMSEKVPWLELKMQRSHQISINERINSNSYVTYKNSESNKTDRYVPCEFRDKHSNNAQSNTTTSKASNLCNSLINSPLLKKEDEIKRNDFGLKYPAQNIFQQKKFIPKIGEKKMLLKQIGYGTPKLRETNSTQSQSPKNIVPLFSSKLSNFTKLKLLGTGRFGDVYLVKHKITGFIAALKIINKADILVASQEQKQKAVNQITREIKLQAFLNHPNLIKLYDFFFDQINIYLLMELACDGHLFQFLQKSRKFSQETSSIIIREVVEGIDFLHKHSIIHRDIKLQNIVFSHGMAKICDFGWSVYCPKEFRTTLCGTPIYLSPQILVGKQYNKKIDIWAIGSLTHQLLTGEDPFKIKSKDDLVRVVEEDFQMKSGSAEVKSFLNFILRKNPSKRPDTETIRRHPYIQKYKDLETSEQLLKLIYNF